MALMDAFRLVMTPVSKPVTALVHKLEPKHRAVALAIFTASVGVLFGGDTSSIHSILKMKAFEEEIAVLDPFPEGVVVTVILMTSVLTGLVSGAVSDRLSRKYTIALGSAIFSIGSIIEAASYSLGVFCFGRAVAGAGEGLFLSIVGVYIAEISPKHLRSQLVLMIQFWTAVGVAGGFFIVFGTSKIDSTFSWRLPFILAATFSAVMAVGVTLCPFSPRWLLTQSRRDEAENVVQFLLGSEPEQHEEREELIAVGLSGTQGRGSIKDGFVAMFSKGYRARTALSVFVNVMQQLSGIDFVLFYAPLLFRQAGLDPDTASFIASGVTGLVILATMIAANWYINRIGRRTLYVLGGVCIASAHFIIGALYASGATNNSVAAQYIVVVAVEWFAFSFSGTWSVTARLYATEIQTGRTRAAASSFGQALNQLVNMAVAISGPGFLAASASGPYWTYGSFSLLAAIVSYIAMPETLGRSLERIDAQFEPPKVVKWTSAMRHKTEEVAMDIRQRRPSRRSNTEIDEGLAFRQGMSRLGSDLAIPENAVL